MLASFEGHCGGLSLETKVVDLISLAAAYETGSDEAFIPPPPTRLPVVAVGFIAVVAVAVIVVVVVVIIVAVDY